MGGRDWNKFNNWFQDPMVDAQDSAGHWPRMGGNGKSGGGGDDEDYKVYRQAMHTLMLEVYYRYLPTSDI